MSNEVEAEITSAELHTDRVVDPVSGEPLVSARMMVTLTMTTEAYRGIDPTRPVYLTQEEP